MQPTKRPLSEISHLFLSEIRQRQTGDAPPPLRLAPRRADEIGPDALQADDVQSAALPAEFARVAPHAAAKHVAVILAGHLSQRPSDPIAPYARHLAADVGRVGLVEADGRRFAITCFDRGAVDAEEPLVLDELNQRTMSEILSELACDVDYWLICLADTHCAEARELLGRAPQWVLMTTADHDGVVATYRTLKGLSELGKRRMSLVVLDAAGEAEADTVFRKLDGVSRQFLACPLESEPMVRPVADITQQRVLECKSTKDVPACAVAPQWRLLMEFLAGATPFKARAQNAASPAETAESKPAPPAPVKEKQPMNISSPVHEVAPAAPAPAPAMSPKVSAEAAPRAAISSPRLAQSATDVADVIDLPAGADDASVLDAVVQKGGGAGEFVACPIKPPMCPEAVLAVGRDHRLLLLAVAGRDLSQLRAIGLAFRWMQENRGLIAMALPPLAIDAHALPMVKLLVDHADLTADLMQPLLQSGSVSVQAYRKLKWGPKTGLLLEAA